MSDVITIKRIRVSGNSLVITLPKELEDRGVVKAGMRFYILLKEDTIILQPVSKATVSKNKNGGSLR